MRRAGLMLGLLVCAALAAVQSAPSPRAPRSGSAPMLEEETPRPGGTLRDRGFGVASQQFGLERHVELYQWRRVGAGFQPVWNSAIIESATFPPQYANPAAMPLQSRRWWAQAPTLAGRPIDREVLVSLGRWTEFRPDFDRLPGNLAASFQPEGNGLGSSENPLEPKIGDIRIRWRELVLPELGGRVELRDGRWRLTREAAAGIVAPAEPTVVIATPYSRVLRDVSPWWLLLVGAVLAAAWGLVRRLRR